MTLFDAIVAKIVPVDIVLAQDTNPIKIVSPTGLGDDITTILNRLYGFGVWAFGAIFIIMVLYAGFQMLTAQGNAGKLTAAWATIKWAAIGYGIYLMAGGIVSVLTALISGPVTK